MAVARVRRRLAALPRGAWVTLLTAALAVALYAAGALFWDARPGSDLALAFGWGAALLLLAVSALSGRKRTMAFASRRGLGRTSTWLSVHMYGGALFLLFVLLHSGLLHGGFGWPDGWVTGWLLGLSVWTVVGGALGRALQRWIPRLITSGLATEVVYERIPELVEAVRERADDLAAGSGREIQDLYDRHLAAELVAPHRRWTYLVDITGGIGERLRSVRYLRERLSTAEAERLDQLTDLYRTKLEIDAHHTLQQTLRAWLWIHVPTSFLLLVFLGLHLWAVLRY